jgi:Restriction endonuclease
MSKAKKHFSHGASGTQSTVSKGRMIEAIVASMHEGVGVKVERNVKLPPIGSQAPKREIDVLLSADVCGYPVRWAFECKNEKKRMGVSYIDSFVGKLQDVGIPPQFGIFVTTSDYSKGAIEQAKKVGIRLLIIRDIVRDLEPILQHAVQTTVFLLPVVNGFMIQNFASSEMSVAEANVLFNKEGEAVSAVPDAIWLAWINGDIPASIGEHEVELEIPVESYQRVGGQLIPVTKFVVKVSIVGLVQQFSGTASLHHLHNVTTHIVERQQLQASFDLLPTDKYQLKTIKTEEQLEQELQKPALVALINRIRLPRIIVARVVKTEKPAKIRATFLLFGHSLLLMHLANPKCNMFAKHRPVAEAIHWLAECSQLSRPVPDEMV